MCPKTYIFNSYKTYLRLITPSSLPESNFSIFSLGPNTVPPPPGTWLNKEEKSSENLPQNFVVENRPISRVNFSPRSTITNNGLRYQNRFSKRDTNPATKNKFNGKKYFSNNVRKPFTNKFEKYNNQNTSFESHPNMSHFKRQGYRNNRKLSNADLDENWRLEGVPTSDGPIQSAPDQIYNKKENINKMNQKCLKELEGEEDLVSMKRKIATRFLLTKAHPRMTIGSVEKHLRQHFQVGEVYIRQNPINHTYYSSFIMIINSDEELNLEEFEQHKWPGEIRCYFAPRDRHTRY